MGKLAGLSTPLMAFLLVGSILSYGGMVQGASVPILSRRDVPLEQFEPEMQALGRQNLGLKAARTLARSLIPLPITDDHRARKKLEERAFGTLEAMVEAMELRDLLEAMLENNISAEIVALHAVVEAVINETCTWVQHLSRYANLSCSREEQADLRVKFQLYMWLESARENSLQYTTILHNTTDVPAGDVNTDRELDWLEESVRCIPPSAQMVIAKSYVYQQNRPVFSCDTGSATY